MNTTNFKYVQSIDALFDKLPDERRAEALRYFAFLAQESAEPEREAEADQGDGSPVEGRLNYLDLETLAMKIGNQRDALDALASSLPSDEFSDEAVQKGMRVLLEHLRGAAEDMAMDCNRYFRLLHAGKT
jgi:hypothetical protein